jgi:hypothetical protein
LPLKAAAALGLLFPWFGLPVGIMFLMLDDPRRTAVGWNAIWWSIGGLVINIIGLIMLIAPVLGIMRAMEPSGSMRSLGGAGASGIPGM